jgi:pyruvate formate lyase activating enzyme
LERLIEKRQVDFVSMDVKAPLDPVHYSRLTGSSIDLDLLWRSISILRRGDVEYEFRMTVVPRLHSVDDVRRLGRQLKAGPRMVLQNFNPESPMDSSLKDTPSCKPEQLRELEKEIQGMT